MTALWARRRLIFSLTLCVAVAAFAATTLYTYLTSLPSVTDQSGPPPSPTATAPHTTYLFGIASFPSGLLHPGDHVQVQWTADVMPRSAGANDAATVVCIGAFYGPYAAAADVPRDGLQQPSRPPVFSTPPLLLSDWDAEPHEAEVVLPATLRPGYYLAWFHSKRAVDMTEEGGAFLVQVAA